MLIMNNDVGPVYFDDMIAFQKPFYFFNIALE